MEALHKEAGFPVGSNHGINEVHHDNRSGQYWHKKKPDIRRLPEAAGYCVLHNDTSYYFLIIQTVNDGYFKES